MVNINQEVGTPYIGQLHKGNVNFGGINMLGPLVSHVPTCLHNFPFSFLNLFLIMLLIGMQAQQIVPLVSMAKMIWSHFASYFSILLAGRNITQIFHAWWGDLKFTRFNDKLLLNFLLLLAGNCGNTGIMLIMDRTNTLMFNDTFIIKHVHQEDNQQELYLANQLKV